jgi:hypothetical protein
MPGAIPPPSMRMHVVMQKNCENQFQFREKIQRILTNYMKQGLLENLWQLSLSRNFSAYYETEGVHENAPLSQLNTAHTLISSFLKISFNNYPPPLTSLK